MSHTLEKSSELCSPSKSDRKKDLESSLSTDYENDDSMIMMKSDSYSIHPPLFSSPQNQIKIQDRLEPTDENTLIIDYPSYVKKDEFFVQKRNEGMSKIAIRSMCDNDATILDKGADNVDSNESDDIITDIKKEKSIYISKPKSRQFFIKKYVYEEDRVVKLSCKGSLRQRREAIVKQEDDFLQQSQNATPIQQTNRSLQQTFLERPQKVVPQKRKHRNGDAIEKSFAEEEKLACKVSLQQRRKALTRQRYDFLKQSQNAIPMQQRNFSSQHTQNFFLNQLQKSVPQKCHNVLEDSIEKFLCNDDEIKLSCKSSLRQRRETLMKQKNNFLQQSQNTIPMQQRNFSLQQAQSVFLEQPQKIDPQKRQNVFLKQLQNGNAIENPFFFNDDEIKLSCKVSLQQRREALMKRKDNFLQPSQNVIPMQPNLSLQNQNIFLEQPLNRDSARRPFVCNEPGCGKRYVKSHSLIIHIRSHTGEKPYVCTIKNCGKSYSRLDSLKDHVRTHEGKPYRCNFPGCKSSFYYYSHYLRHKKIHIERKVMMHKCAFPNCGKSYEFASVLAGHMYSHYKEKFKCDYPECTRKYTSFADIERHKKTHDGLFPYKCNIPGCNKSFNRSSNLADHRHVHSNERPFVCNFDGCGKSFKRVKYMKTHQKNLHYIEVRKDHRHDERPFICEIDDCGKRFKRVKYMRTHQKHLHHLEDNRDSERPFVCEIDDCGKRFKRVKYMKTHQRNLHYIEDYKDLRHDERPFVCEINDCEKRFKKVKYMKTHQKNIHHLEDHKVSERPFICEIDDCGKRFKMAKYMKTHQRNLH